MNSSTSHARLSLIVGDEDLVGLIRSILASAALDVRAATTGQAGLELVRDDAPDLILLDLALPDMNGWELFMQFQALEACPPIIILATQASRVDRTFGLRVAQAHDFLVKPFLPSQLRRSVAAALNRQPDLLFRHAVTQYGA